MNKEVKAENVAELKETLAKVASIVVTDYRGLKVEEVNGLRREIGKSDCCYRVVKNTLFKRAIAGTTMESIATLFKGPTAIAYSYNDPIAPAKIIEKFAATLDKLNVKGGYVDGKALNSEGVKDLATMKGKDELRAEFLMMLQAPAQEFVRLLNAGPQQFMYLLSAREDKLNEEK